MCFVVQKLTLPTILTLLRVASIPVLVGGDYKSVLTAADTSHNEQLSSCAIVPACTHNNLVAMSFIHTVTAKLVATIVKLLQDSSYELMAQHEPFLSVPCT